MSRGGRRYEPGEALEIDDHPWVVATRITLAVVAAILGVLVVTGIMLVFDYRPDLSAAYAFIQHVPSHSQTRDVHRLASRLLFPAFGGLAIAATGLALVRHRPWRILAVVIGGIGVLAASVTGFMLPWDQMSLNHVTVGTNISGYGRILFGHDVKYVIVGSNLIGTATIARWFWVHVLGTSLTVIVALVVVALETRAQRPSRSDQSGSEPEAIPSVTAP